MMTATLAPTPTNATITRLTEARQGQVDFIDQLNAAANAETRDLVDAEMRNIADAETRIQEIDAQLEPLVAFERRRASAVVVGDLGRPAFGQPAGGGGLEVETRSLGQIWTESDEYHAYTGRGTSGVVLVPEFRAVGPDPLLTTTVPGSVLAPKSVQFRVPEHYGPFPLLSLVTPIEVSSNSVEIITTTDASGADVVAEGAQKPPVVWTASPATVTLETVAGWFKYSRQSLKDIPQLRSLIDQKIRRAIDVKLNALLAAAVDAATSGGNTTVGDPGVTLPALIRGAISTLQGRGVVPTVILMNPADHAAYDLAMMTGTLNGAVINGTMFGLPIVDLSTLPLGQAIVGDVGEALAWFYRSGLELYTTDSDVSGEGATAKSDFRGNILTTLGEVRGKFGITDASQLQHVTSTP